MNKRKLTLHRTTLRQIGNHELEQVQGGGDTDTGWTTTLAPSRICPPPSMYTGCPACAPGLPDPSVVINPGPIVLNPSGGSVIKGR